jgi:hypothetical protein
MKLFKWILIAATLLAAGVGCSQPANQKTTTNIAQAQATTTAQAKTLDTVGKTVAGLTPANVPNQKPLLSSEVKQAQAQNGQIATALGVAQKSAKADEAVIASASNPVQVRLNWASGICLVVGVLALVAGMFFSTYLGGIASWLRSGGAALLVAGVLLYAIARFIIPLITALFWAATAVTGVALVAGAVWAYLHRNSLVPVVEAWFGQAVKKVDGTIPLPAPKQA